MNTCSTPSSERRPTSTPGPRRDQLVNIMDYGLVTKSFGAGCKFEEVAKKIL